MPDGNEPFNRNAGLKGNGPNPLDPVKWPCVHPMLKYIEPVEGEPYYRSVWDTALDDDIADELNRLATIDACANLARCNLDCIKLKGCLDVGSKSDLINLHARLVQETLR
jgi:hypothetical protein